MPLNVALTAPADPWAVTKPAAGIYFSSLMTTVMSAQPADLYQAHIPLESIIRDFVDLTPEQSLTASLPPPPSVLEVGANTAAPTAGKSGEPIGPETMAVAAAAAVAAVQHMGTAAGISSWESASAARRASMAQMTPMVVSA